MTGSQVVAVLEDAIASALDTGGSTGAYPYAAGIRFDVNASRSKGSRVSNVEYKPRATNVSETTSWEPLQVAASYVVVTQDYIAGGKDNYLTFADQTWTNMHTMYTQTWIDWLELGMAGAVMPLPVSDYSTQRYVSADNCDHSVHPYPLCSGP